MTVRVQQTSLLSFFKEGKALPTQKSCEKANPMPKTERKSSCNDCSQHASRSANLYDKQLNIHSLSQGPSQNTKCSSGCENVQNYNALETQKGASQVAAACQQNNNKTNNAPALPLISELGPGLKPCHEKGPHGTSPKEMPPEEGAAEAKELSIQGTKRKRVEVPGPSQELETDLERQRADNIRRNEEFLASLGIESNFLASKKAQTGLKPKQPKKMAPPIQIPIRRSTRARGLVVECNSGLVASSLKAPGVEPEENLAPLHYDNSSVRKYTCRMQGEGAAEEAGDFGGEAYDSLRPTGVTYCDPLMTRVYALYSTEGSSGRLLAAGGHAGRLAVFGVGETARLAASDCARVDTRGEGDMETAHGAAEEPLMAWKGGNGWISAVQFLTQQRQEGATLLLTSSNDRSVVLWDIDKVSVATRKRAVATSTVLF